MSAQHTPKLLLAAISDSPCASTHLRYHAVTLYGALACDSNTVALRPFDPAELISPATRCRRPACARLFRADDSRAALAKAGAA